MTRQAILLMLMPALVAFNAAAQQGESPKPTILQGSEVTESALVNALTPGRLRSFQRVPPSASLLIEFDTNSTGLTAEGKQLLNIVGKAVNTNALAPYKFVVEGHADPRGRPEVNQRLSQRRANVVRRYLVQNEKVNSSRLQAVGKGDRYPLDRENPAAAVNRRVTFITRQ